MAPWSSRSGVSSHKGDGRVVTRLYSSPTKETGTTYPPFESELSLWPAFIDRTWQKEDRTSSSSGFQQVWQLLCLLWWKLCCRPGNKPVLKMLLSHREAPVKSQPWPLCHCSQMLEQSELGPLSSTQTSCRLMSQMGDCCLKSLSFWKLHNAGRKPEMVRAIQRMVSIIGAFRLRPNAG